jgi:hypothetical protein
MAWPILFFFISQRADVVPYSAHIPSYADTWGWVMVLYLTHSLSVLKTINPPLSRLPKRSSSLMMITLIKWFQHLSVPCNFYLDTNF